MWDPAFVGGAARVAFVDSDALFVRNASALSDIDAPAAFYLRDDCKPPNVDWATWDPGIVIDGATVPKAEAYWNSGVVVYEPDAAIYAELERMPVRRRRRVRLGERKRPPGIGIGTGSATSRRWIWARTSARATCSRPTTGARPAARCPTR